MAFYFRNANFSEYVWNNYIFTNLSYLITNKYPKTKIKIKKIKKYKDKNYNT